MPHLFLATIGPVQPFIKSARRTHDLFVGSMLLSELSKSVALALTEGDGKDTQLIFPAPLNKEHLQPDTNLSVANKIIAVISQEPHEVAIQVKNALFKRLHEVSERVYDRLKAIDIEQAYGRLEAIDIEQAYQQIDGLLDFAWVATPFDDLNYADTRLHLEALLSARKNTRYFAPLVSADSSRRSSRYKSSIDGQLECVIPDACYDKKHSPKQRADVLFRRYKAGPDEYLSGVDLVKRNAHFPQLPAILSTSHISTLPFLKRLNAITDPKAKKELQDAWKTYVKHIDQNTVLSEKIPKETQTPDTILGDRDGALLFDERLLVDLTSEQYTSAHTLLEAFWHTVRNVTGISLRPTPYYAIINADGDSMGDVINALAKGGLTHHRSISQQLDAFAQNARTIVQEYEGVPVYTGGDDVLALLPLHTVLACAHALAVDFAQKMGGFQPDGVRPPTLSVGIAIVHHLSLLQDSLEAAREAEKCAKKYPEKNALAITVLKRSGEPITVSGSWGHLYPWLETLISHFHQQHIPKGTAYELRDVYQRLSSGAQEPSAALGQVMQYEAYRILRRKIMLNSAMSKQAQAETLNALLQRLHIEISASSGPKITMYEDIGPFINELLVVQPIVEALDIAYGKGEQIH